jgi:hypothetical protein
MLACVSHEREEQLLAYMHFLRRDLEQNDISKHTYRQNIEMDPWKACMVLVCALHEPTADQE